MMRGALVLAGLALTSSAHAPAGAAMEDDTVMVPLFVQACATGTPSAEAIEARMNADSAWQRLTDADLAADEFGTVKSMQPIGDFGLKANSVDLVHYMAFSGKLADGRKARGDIFSRTRVLQPGDNMHMYLAF